MPKKFNDLQTPKVEDVVEPVAELPIPAYTSMMMTPKIGDIAELPVPVKRGPPAIPRTQTLPFTVGPKKEPLCYEELTLEAPTEEARQRLYLDYRDVQSEIAPVQSATQSYTPRYTVKLPIYPGIPRHNVVIMCLVMLVLGFSLGLFVGRF